MSRFPTIMAGALVAAVCLVPAVAGEEAPAERVAVGEEAPGFTLPGVEGAEHALEGLRGENRAVLVFYRGGW